MRPSEKVELIKRIGKRLETDSWTDIDLTLRQFDLPWSSEWESGDKYAYCVRHLEAGNEDSLLALRDYLFGAPGGDPLSAGPELPWQTNRFRLFLSHISAQKEIVSEVKISLGASGVDAFVAHQDIEPTKKWLDQVEIALQTCDALAAILTEGFHESDWTDQEVGFCVNRRVLVVPVRLGVDPYGFISRYQAFTPSLRNSLAVATGLFDILCKHDLTAEKMGSALVSHFADSGSFADARKNVKLLQRVKTWTPEMLREIEQSVEKNRQIREAINVPEAVRAILKTHGK